MSHHKEGAASVAAFSKKNATKSITMKAEIF